MPASIGGAGGAIKLKPGDLNSDTKTGGAGGGAGKKKKGLALSPEQTLTLTRITGALKFMSLININRCICFV